LSCDQRQLDHGLSDGTVFGGLALSGNNLFVANFGNRRLANTTPPREHGKTKGKQGEKA